MTQVEIDVLAFMFCPNPASGRVTLNWAGGGGWAPAWVGDTWPSYEFALAIDARTSRCWAHLDLPAPRWKEVGRDA